MWASAVSLPTRVARTTRRPSTLMVAPTTSSPAPTSTGTLSPVTATCRRTIRRPRPRRRWRPARPGGTTNRSPTASSVDRTALLAPVAVEHGGLRGAELGQGAQRAAGAALGAGLEVAAAEDQGDRRRGDLEVDVVRLAAGRHQRHHHLHPVVAGMGEQQRADAGGERGEHADRHERVHRGRAVAGVLPGGPVERPRRPGRHRRGEHEARPTASCGTAARRSSTARSTGTPSTTAVTNRSRSRRSRSAGSSVSPASSAAAAPAAAGRRRRQQCPVADRLDGLDQLVGRRQRRVVADPGLLGGVVDRGRDAVEPVELLLDARRARGAGHPGDGQVELGRTGDHQLALADAHGTTTVNGAVTTSPSWPNCRNARYVPLGGSPVNVNTFAA